VCLASVADGPGLGQDRTEMMTMRDVGGTLYRRRKLLLAALLGAALLLTTSVVVARVVETLAPAIRALD